MCHKDGRKEWRTTYLFYPKGFGSSPGESQQNIVKESERELTAVLNSLDAVDINVNDLTLSGTIKAYIGLSRLLPCTARMESLQAPEQSCHPS